MSGDTNRASPKIVMAGQAKRDPATQWPRVCAAARRIGIADKQPARLESLRRVDTRRLGGRVKPGHDEFFWQLLNRTTVAFADHDTKGKGTVTFVMVDVEADGPIPGDYSMIALGAVIVEPGLARKFGARLKPIGEKWIPEALAVSGFSRAETLAFDEPKDVMLRLRIGWCRKRKGSRGSSATTTGSIGSL